MLGGMFESGAMPALERLVQFTNQRQRLLADSIANVSTPTYKPRDLDPRAFQKVMRTAIAQRRAAAGGVPAGELRPMDTPDMAFREGGIEVKPRPSNRGILYHDQNNRDLERMMQHLAENTLMHNAGVELMRNQFETMRIAIRERF